MIERKHIGHVELIQLGRMLLLLTDQQQITMGLSSPAESKEEETVAHEHLGRLLYAAWFTPAA